MPPPSNFPPPCWCMMNPFLALKYESRGNFIISSRGKIGPNKYLTGDKGYIMNIMYTICLSRKKPHPWLTTSNDCMMLSSSVNSSSGSVRFLPFLTVNLLLILIQYLWQQIKRHMVIKKKSICETNFTIFFIKRCTCTCIYKSDIFHMNTWR